MLKEKISKLEKMPKGVGVRLGVGFLFLVSLFTTWQFSMIMLFILTQIYIGESKRKAEEVDLIEGLQKP